MPNTNTVKQRGYADRSLSDPYLDNPVINGDFRIWQRGTSFAAIANAAYCADRWKVLLGGAAVFTIAQSADAPAVAALLPFSSSSLALTTTTADAAVATTDVVSILQRIEGYTWEPFAQKQFTLGFWVKDSVTGVHTVSLNNGTDRYYVDEYTINTANTWEYKEIRVQPSPAAGTWNYTTGVGLDVMFNLMVGSSFQTTKGAWQTGTNLYGTSSNVNSVATNGNVFKLWGVSITPGPTARPFFPRPYPQELALCQRYFYQQVGLGNLGSFPGAMSGTTQPVIFIPFPVEMRARPTTITTNINAFTNAIPTGTQIGVYNYRIGSYFSGGTFSSLGQWGSSTRLGVVFVASSTSFTSAVAGDVIEAGIGPSGVIGYSAEL